MEQWLYLVAADTILVVHFLFVAFVGIWQLVTMVGVVSPIILPTPGEVLEDLVIVGNNLISGSYLLKALWITTLEVFYGFALAF